MAATIPSTVMLPDVDRVEVIDEVGRAYTNCTAEDVWLCVQDEGKTLKIFLRSGD